jgi:hypothetical protein
MPSLRTRPTILIDAASSPSGRPHERTFASAPHYLGGMDRRLATYSSNVADGWLYGPREQGGPVTGDIP